MPLRALLPLAALTFAVALATSRYGLVVHELVGHGGTALALGGAAHVGLLVAERTIRVDPVYTAIMKTEGQRQVERDVAVAQAAHPEVTPAQLEAIRRASEQQHRPFPFGPLLMALVAASAIASMMRTRPAPSPRELPWRAVAWPALVAAIGVFLVAVIDTIA